MNILPQARTSDIVVQHLKGETLVYDLITNKALCLNETLSAVFNSCGSQSSFDDLKRRHKYTDELIYLALDELKRENLLAGKVPFVSPFAGMTRREAVRRVGLATMIALPLITGLIAPTAVTAQSAPVCNGNQPAGSTVSCANNSNDCGTNANAAGCQTCTTVFTTNFPNCIANGFAGACQCT